MLTAAIFGRRACAGKTLLPHRHSELHLCRAVSPAQDSSADPFTPAAARPGAGWYEQEDGRAGIPGVLIPGSSRLLLPVLCSEEVTPSLLPQVGLFG